MVIFCYKWKKCSWKITFIKITLLKNISSNWRYFFVWKKITQKNKVDILEFRKKPE